MFFNIYHQEVNEWFYKYNFDINYKISQNFSILQKINYFQYVQRYWADYYIMKIFKYLIVIISKINITIYNCYKLNMYILIIFKNLKSIKLIIIKIVI